MIKLVIMDVDGTLTDGKINISPNGELFKSFNVKDGYGIVNIQKKGVIPIILTGRNSEIVSIRANELKITDVRQGISDKITELRKILEHYNVTFDEVAYIGDDINDLDIFKSLKYTFAPNDAYQSVKEIAYKILSLNGGEGAVREALDEIILINESVNNS